MVFVVDAGILQRLRLLLKTAAGTPITGKSPTLFIRRQSDDAYWTGAAWSTITWLNATEENNGLYYYDFTFPDDADKYVVYWIETTLPVYTISEYDAITSRNATSDLYTYDAYIQDKFTIPIVSTSLTVELAIGGATANVTSTTDLPNQGYVKIDSEYIHYSGRTSNTLTGLSRGKFGTSAALHVVDSTVYQLRIYEAWLRATGADGELLTLVKDPKFGIADIEMNTIMASADMIKLVEGLYYSRIFLIPTDIARDWRALFTLYHTGETSDSDIVKDVEVVNEPLTQVVYNTTSGGPIRFHENGYYKADGITYVPWTDVMKGPITDGSGSPVGGVVVRAFLTSAGVPLISDRHPPFDNAITGGTNDAGKYIGSLNPEAGGTTYQFTFEKEGYQFARVNRTLSP